MAGRITITSLAPMMPSGAVHSIIPGRAGGQNPESSFCAGPRDGNGKLCRTVEARQFAFADIEQLPACCQKS